MFQLANNADDHDDNDNKNEEILICLHYIIILIKIKQNVMLIFWDNLTKKSTETEKINIFCNY